MSFRGFGNSYFKNSRAFSITLSLFFKKRFTIELDTVPQTNEDICFAIAKYCAEFNLSYEFIHRGYPVVAIIDGCKYQITKQFANRYGVNLWVLRCNEID